MTHMIFTYRENPAWARRANEPRLYAAIDLSPLGVAAKVDRLPIYIEPVDAGEVTGATSYRTWVAGLPIERRRLDKLATTVEHYLGALIHYASLPEYVFQLGERAWPIYRYEGQLLARFPGSRHFAAETIGELRNELADHFKASGVIGYRKEMTVLQLARHDLQLYAPACTLRVPGMVEIPVFRDRTTADRLIAPLNGHSIHAPLASGAGILALPGLVGDYLAVAGRLDDPDDVGVRKLTATAWAAAARHLHPYGCHFTYTDHSGDDRKRRRIPIFVDEVRGQLTAARTNRMGRVSLHFASDVPHLQYKVGKELTQLGKIAVPTYVTVNSIEETVHAAYLNIRAGSVLAPFGL